MERTIKQKIRERILTLLNNQKEEERLQKSLFIKDKLFSLNEFARAKQVLFYASFDGEVNTLEMIKQAKLLGKRIALPVVSKDRRNIILALFESFDDLAAGPYGIKQPTLNGKNEVQPDDIDLVVVPGLAFDRNKNRLGRGGGYYDRLLSSLPNDIPTVGLAFDFQVVDSLPIEAHDHSVTHLLTN